MSKSLLYVVFFFAFNDNEFFSLVKLFFIVVAQMRFEREMWSKR